MTDNLPALNCWFLTGPTASGKTGVGIALAKRLDAEIVSLDSMALYRGMDIGTAKPTAEQRAAVPHHLIDLIDPEEEFSVARYLDAAADAIADVRSRGREVLFVGGTPLYLKALLRGLFDGPEADWKFRSVIEEELQRVGQQALYDRLAQVDPLAAAKLHPNDTRRLIRALEVYRITGQPISHQQMEFDEGRPTEACRVFVLQRPKEQLHARIDGRVKRMFDDGLVDEARRLTSGGRRLGRTAGQAVGYCEALDHIGGELSVEEAILRVTTRTRRFAKRQATWFRSLSECRLVPVEGDMPDETVAEQILSLAGHG